MKRSLRKRILSVGLALILCANIMGVAIAQMFSDISTNWARQAILNLSQKGIINGYPDGTFRPDGLISRAEFAAVLVRAKQLENVPISRPNLFADVPPSLWAYRPIEIVAGEGLVSGYPGGVFRPNQDITRAEAMSVLVKAANIPLPSVDQAERILSAYNDANTVPQWAKPYVAAAIQSGIFARFPNGNQIDADKPATRADIAMLTNNMETYMASGRPGMPMTPPEAVTAPVPIEQGPPIRGHIVVVPSNTTFTAVSTATIDSETGYVGQPVSLTLNRPLLSSSGDIVIPQGSKILGSITQLSPVGRGEKNATLGMNFNQILTPDGKSYGMSAIVNANNGVLVGGTTKGRVGRIAGKTLGGAVVGGGAGAIVGQATSHHGKETGQGALWGGLIGAGLGGIASIAGKGKPVQVQPGEVLELQLLQPLSITTP